MFLTSILWADPVEAQKNGTETRSSDTVLNEGNHSNLISEGVEAAERQPFCHRAEPLFRRRRVPLFHKQQVLPSRKPVAQLFHTRREQPFRRLPERLSRTRREQLFHTRQVPLFRTPEVRLFRRQQEPLFRRPLELPFRRQREPLSHKPAEQPFRKLLPECRDRKNEPRGYQRGN